MIREHEFGATSGWLVVFLLLGAAAASVWLLITGIGGSTRSGSSRRSWKAAMVSNLLVVLCSERSTQPIVNTGTLHH